MKKFLILTITGLFLLAVGVNAQVRPAESEEEEEPKAEMLESFEVKYTGGLYGFSKSEHGTVAFDDINERLIFKGEDGKERFSLPYNTILIVYPSQTKVRSGTGRAVGALPIPGAGIAGMFMKKKKNYLVVRFEDTDVDAEGAINFLVDTADILRNSIYTIGEKAEMKPRGDAYIRKNDY
jgi:hypothetical protein